jgi:hypothetical protein
MTLVNAPCLGSGTAQQSWTAPYVQDHILALEKLRFQKEVSGDAIRSGAQERDARADSPKRKAAVQQGLFRGDN